MSMSETIEMDHYYRGRPRATDSGLGKTCQLSEEQLTKVAEIHDWLINGGPRSKRIYYVGDLGSDVSPFIDEVRALMWHAMENGVVHLFQRRTDKVGSFEYIAVKRYPADRSLP
jgi:hypothetical protein